MNATRRLAVESLERRSLLAATLSGGILTVTGTAGDDEISFATGLGNGTDTLFVNEIVRGADPSTRVQTPFTLSQVTGIRVEAGAGNDLVTFVFLGTAPDAVPYDGPSTLFGGAGSDTLIGGTGDDEIHCGSGLADSAIGNDGDDLIYGDGGSLDLLFGDGNHQGVGGGDGDDTIYGNNGRDEIYGGAGNDLLHGGTGNDRLRGEAGRDQLYGGAGNDILYGGGSADRLYAGPLTPGPLGNNDVFLGGTGHDHFVGNGIENSRVWDKQRDELAIDVHVNT